MISFGRPAKIEKSPGSHNLRGDRKMTEITTHNGVTTKISELAINNDEMAIKIDAMTMTIDDIKIKIDEITIKLDGMIMKTNGIGIKLDEHAI